MPRGIRETRFFILEQPTRKNQVKPNIRVFDSTPAFKRWVEQAEISIDKQTQKVMWLSFPDERWALAFKGYSLACIDGRVLI